MTGSKGQLAQAKTNHGVCLVLAVALVGSALWPTQASFAQAPQARLDPTVIAQELSIRPDDPLLNFLSGMAYEGAATGSMEARELARVGYVMALRQDSGFWRASYQLGLMALEDRDPLAARRFLLAAAQHARAEVRVMRALARAAYCAGDIALAASAMDRADTLQPATSEEDLLTIALIAAARNDRALLDGVQARLPAHLREALENRVATPREPLALSSTATAAPETGGTDVQAPDAKRMAVVDVVIIRRVESAGTRSGINLLDSLSLQLGGNLINRSWSKVTDKIDPTYSTYTISTDSSLQLTIPAVTYSLNLANARGNSSRIEARPTLLVLDGSEAKVFNGGTLTFATDGQLSSSSETREVGLSLSVRPKFISTDAVNLGVTVTLENFVASPPAGSFRQAVQTEKSSTEVAADIRFGQTMLVSGGTSTNITRAKSRTPVIGDIPMLGGLFNGRSENRQDNELIVLLSLRRVPGQAALREGVDEQAMVADLRQKLFPGLSETTLFGAETRQIFYRLANPARGGVAGYLAPLAADNSLGRFLSNR